MKRNKLLIGIMLSGAVLAVTSCEDSKDTIDGDIEGAYIGLFSESASLKSAFLDGEGDHDGTAVVAMMGENQIQVHCYGSKIDTTFMLDYYEHNDSVMVCLTGNEFESMYGHMLGEGHMSGGMMGDRGSGESEWMHHMDDEHQDGDEHFGGFNMNDGSFSYSFHMMDNQTPYYLKFHGIKDE